MAQGADTAASDIPVGGWVDRYVPAAWRPYIRLARYDRPIGTWLLLFPCWWAIALASAGWPSLWLMILFGIGAMVMRGAGCTYNDICDRDFDAQVARTRNRPLPAGEVTVRQAVVFLVAQLAVGLAILLSFNRFAIAVGAASLILVFTYPLMKRVTFWPQVFLGLAFNWGALLGWAAVRGDLALPAFLLYAGGILWTLGYDTIYAHQDRTDDVVAGVKSSARALGVSKPWLYGFYAGAAVFITMAGAAASLSYVFHVGMALGAAHLAWQIWVVDLNDPKDCLRIFRSNRVFGWTLLSAVIVGQIVR